jgi:hypothetical protein
MEAIGVILANFSVPKVGSPGYKSVPYLETKNEFSGSTAGRQLKAQIPDTGREEKIKEEKS